MSQPRILAIAYACMPGVGSEPEAGWAWARIAAGIGETWVLTRPWPDRRDQLAAALAAAPERASMHLVYVDLPRWLGSRRWDPFLKGHQRLEYVLWQLFALRTGRRVARRNRIDVVWHLTFANAWIGSVGALLGRPFVLGPVGGGVGTPWRLLREFGMVGSAIEIIRSLVRGTARHANPLARLAWSRASLILVQNRETYGWLPASARSRTEIFHNAVIEPPDVKRTRCGSAGSPPVALFAGRLVPFKAAHLAVETIARLPEWHLIIYGAGPEEGRLRLLARRLGIDNRIELRGWAPRAEVLRAMRDDADVFLFPSMHDEGSFVVAEALAADLPVVCLDRGGPPIVGGGRPVHVGSRQQTIDRLASAVEASLHERGPRPPLPTIEERRQAVVGILRRHGILSAGSDEVPG